MVRSRFNHQMGCFDEQNSRAIFFFPQSQRASILMGLAAYLGGPRARQRKLRSRFFESRAKRLRAELRSLDNGCDHAGKSGHACYEFVAR